MSRNVQQDDLELKLQHLPARPGVYLFKDATGEPIYIGKANSLRSRLSSYFQELSALNPRTRSMVTTGRPSRTRSPSSPSSR